MKDFARISAMVLLVVVLMAAAARVQAERERRYPPVMESPESLDIRSGPAVRRLSVAYAPLAADLYWIRALQHYGGIKRELTSGPMPPGPPAALAANDPPDAYPLLYPLLDLTTTLDPRFNVAYRFGSVF